MLAACQSELWFRSVANFNLQSYLLQQSQQCQKFDQPLCCRLDAIRSVTLQIAKIDEPNELAEVLIVLSKLSLKFAFTLLALGVLRIEEPLLAQQEPEVQAIAAAGRKTSELLEREPAAWTVVFELSNGTEALTEVVSAVTMRRIDVSFKRAERMLRLVRIIERDGLWYVADQLGYFKYRRYEATFIFPPIYAFLSQSELRTVVDESEPLGSFDQLQSDVATYRKRMPTSVKQKLQANLENLLKLEESHPEKGTTESALIKQNLQQQLQNDTELKINLETGIIEQFASVGQRWRVQDFQWLETTDFSVFDVSEIQWEDRSSSIFADQNERNKVIMIGHAMAWQPGQQARETDLLLLDIFSGQTRRVPFALGVAGVGCFSRDRTRIYISGQIPDYGSLGIFEIDLNTGQHRHLGGRELEFGITMFPTLSPNGLELAVIHLDPASGPVSSQVYLIDIASGRSRAIGKPLDTGHLSWLPSGDGLVLVSREHKAIDLPAVSTICRMNFEGNLTEIRPGDFPVVLPDSRILFRDSEDDLWKTCDLQGQDVEFVGDGLKSFSFPAPSPDGQCMIMLKFGAATCPQPHLIDIATGKRQPIQVGGGLWTTPSWR